MGQVMCIRIMLLFVFDDPVDTPDQYVSVQLTVVLVTVESFLSSANAFLLWIKFFKYLGNLSPKIGCVPIPQAYSGCICCSDTAVIIQWLMVVVIHSQHQY